VGQVEYDEAVKDPFGLQASDFFKDTTPDANDAQDLASMQEPSDTDGENEGGVPFDYDDIQPGETRPAWRSRLKLMTVDDLFSSKINLILDDMVELRNIFPAENIVVSSKSLKLLDMLRAATAESPPLPGDVR
jgi:hypothetical protein